MSDAQPTGERTGFGTLEGVFIPTLLTILGVIMYLRLGWVVGNAGLGLGVVIIVIAFAITGATGLSLSSVVTNIRIGAGGAFSIISRSLGLEVAGSVGIPLYLAQTLAVAMYVFGFRAGWLYVFPDHPSLVVDLVIFAALFGIASVSASFAFRTNYVVLAIIVASLVSIGIAAATGSMNEPITWVGDFPGAPENDFAGASFWEVWAVFFPAATGILAGANLSGELRDPRRSIPRGTLGAMALSLVIYLVLAVWLARSATTDELVENYTAMIDLAAFGPAVIAGLLGATFSSALSSLVGAPRILQALAEQGVVPGASVFASVDDRGEPRNATLLTAGIVVLALLLRDLNAIAPLITMFFLITYAMLNVVVVLEKRLGLVSFRPLLRVHWSLPVLGMVGCLFAMFIVNPAFALAAVVLVMGFYAYLTRRKLDAPGDDMRSGLFVAVAEWAAKRASELESGDSFRAWKANILVPAEASGELRGEFRLIHAIAHPKGSVKLVGIDTDGAPELREERLEGLAEDFRREGVFTTWTSLEAEDLHSGVVTSMQALRGGFMRPNLIFLRRNAEDVDPAAIQLLQRQAHESGLGVLLYADHPRAGLGRRRHVRLWLEGHDDWALRMDLPNLDVATLVAYKLRESWDAELHIAAVVADDDETAQARAFLDHLLGQARLSATTEVVHSPEGLVAAGDQVEPADLNILALPEQAELDRLDRLVDAFGGACLAAHDSGRERAFA